jgi:hypothetical protein
MSFGANQQTKGAANSLQNIGSTAQTNSADQINAGTNLLNKGEGNVDSGANYFNTLLNGNQENTASMLEPDINRIRAGNQNALQTASTLMPRGGGRAATLFNQPFQNNAQIQSLFNGARSGAAAGLAGIGGGQMGMGANLFGIGNGALNTGMGANTNLANYGLQQQQVTNGLWSGLGQGVAGLLTAPFGSGGGSLWGKIFGQ